MDAQQLNDELGNAGAQALVRSSSLCHLAYLGGDGLPRAIPIVFYWTGERVVVCTATTAPKVRALATRPEVAVTIDRGSEPENAVSLLIRGQATLQTVDGIPDEYLQASSKSWDEKQRLRFAQQVRSVYGQMVRISIEPYWARFYDFGAGRLPGFLTRLVSGR
jgi:nitroimidazol reductase NimA-like FMN-containing flavoprotein (pyridoxamine 5'-phosphate oxidase superfamily)